MNLASASPNNAIKPASHLIHRTPLGYLLRDNKKLPIEARLLNLLSLLEGRKGKQETRERVACRLIAEYTKTYDWRFREDALKIAKENGVSIERVHEIVRKNCNDTMNNTMSARDLHDAYELAERYGLRPEMERARNKHVQQICLVGKRNYRGLSNYDYIELLYGESGGRSALTEIVSEYVKSSSEVPLEVRIVAERFGVKIPTHQMA